jgi:Straboviridae ATP-dependent DNA helicase UvsW
VASIVIFGNYAKLVDETDHEFLSQLNKHLSFKYAGAEFMPAFKYHHWDGKEYLLSKKLEFLTGLVNYVKDFYIDNGRNIEVIDERPKPTNGKKIDISSNLAKLNLNPYDYQLEAIEYAIKYDRVIFKHATGGGKSLTAALITAELGKPTIIYVISKELLHQFYEFFSLLFDQKIGIIGDGICEVENITIASVWTVGRSLGMKPKEIFLDDESSDEEFDESNAIKIIDCIKKAKIHQFDECHISAAKTIRNIYKTINPEKIYGYSGTPYRDDGADLLLTGIFGDIIHEVKASNLIKRKILAKPFIKFINIYGKANFRDTYQTVYSDHIVNNRFRNNIIASETKSLLDKGYNVLVLFKTIKHGKLLAEIFEEEDIEFEFLSGKDNAKKRKSVKDALLSGRSRCIIASTIYDIGIDVKTLSALVLTSSGKSSVKALQRIGRVIRNGNEKPMAAVVDFYDQVKYLKKHSLIRKSIYETEPEFDIFFPKVK